MPFVICRAIFALALTVMPALAGSASAAESPAPSPPTVAECASPKLPHEILDGDAGAQDDSALPVVDAKAPGLALRLAVADDDASRELGLMCVLRLRPQHGMIFVFPTTRQEDFWMKNTLVPLDMVWLMPDGTITTIAAAVPAATRSTPDDAVARRSGLGKYVIELTSGEAATDKLKVGGRLKMPPLRTSH